jgi:hypothetical protein
MTRGDPDGQANRDQYCNVRNCCAHPFFVAHKIEAFVFYNMPLITEGGMINWSCLKGATGPNLNLKSGTGQTPAS